MSEVINCVFITLFHYYAALSFINCQFFILSQFILIDAIKESVAFFFSGELQIFKQKFQRQCMIPLTVLNQV